MDIVYFQLQILNLHSLSCDTLPRNGKNLPPYLKNEGTLCVPKQKLKKVIKPKKYFHFKYGSKGGSTLLIQLCLGRSFFF